MAGGRVTDVFVEPATGWHDAFASAVLADPALAGDGANSVAIDGDTIVATMTGAPGAEDVFTAPAGGWSGTVAPAARLVDTGGRPVSGAVIDGSTIAARSAAGDAVDIFTEPAGGWSGTIQPVAQLVALDGLAPRARLAITSSAVFVSGTHATDVFDAPAGGWTATMMPSATLRMTGDVSASGSTALVDGSVFTEPSGGWSGSLAPAASTAPRLPGTVGGPLGSQELVSGRYVVTAQLRLSSGGGCDDIHLCTIVDRTATAPASGWSGPVLTAPLLTVSTEDSLAVAVSGADLFQTDGNRVSVFGLPAAAGSRLIPPTARSAHATGFAGATPGLRLTMHAGAGQPPIRRLTVTLPRGLSWDRHPGVLARGVMVAGIPIHRSPSGRGVTLSPAVRGQLFTGARRPRTIRLSIGRRALRVSGALRRQVRAGRHPTVRVRATATTAFVSWHLVFRVRV